MTEDASNLRATRAKLTPRRIAFDRLFNLGAIEGACQNQFAGQRNMKV